MTFLGGEVTIPTPTRAALILSAKQWAKAASDRAFESGCCASHCEQDASYIISCCERIEKALVELEGLEK